MIYNISYSSISYNIIAHCIISHYTISRSSQSTDTCLAWSSPGSRRGRAPRPIAKASGVMSLLSTFGIHHCVW